MASGHRGRLGCGGLENGVPRLLVGLECRSVLWLSRGHEYPVVRCRDPWARWGCPGCSESPKLCVGLECQAVLWPSRGCYATGYTDPVTTGETDPLLSEKGAMVRKGSTLPTDQPDRPDLPEAGMQRTEDVSRSLQLHQKGFGSLRIAEEFGISRKSPRPDRAASVGARGKTTEEE